MCNKYLLFTVFISCIIITIMFGLQGLVNNLLEKLIDNLEMGLVTPQWIPNDMATQETPEKTQKKKSVKQTVIGKNTSLGHK